MGAGDNLAPTLYGRWHQPIRTECRPAAHLTEQAQERNYGSRDAANQFREGRHSIYYSTRPLRLTTNSFEGTDWCSPVLIKMLALFQVLNHTTSSQVACQLDCSIVRRQVVGLQMTKSLPISEPACIRLGQRRSSVAARERNCRCLFTTRQRIGRGAATLGCSSLAE